MKAEYKKIKSAERAAKRTISNTKLIDLIINLNSWGIKDTRLKEVLLKVSRGYLSKYGDANMFVLDRYKEKALNPRDDRPLFGQHYFGDVPF